MYYRLFSNSSAVIDYGRMLFKPEDANVQFMVVVRPDSKGNLHQLLCEKKFAGILNESENYSNIESESELEEMTAISDEEAEERRWTAWVKMKRGRNSKT